MKLLPLIATLWAMSSPDGGVAPRADCPSLSGHQHFLWWRLGPSMRKIGPPPGGTARRFLEVGDSSLRSCPRNETIWYAVLRAHELTTPNRKAPLDVVEAARAAVPNSVWIETVRARALGTVEVAEAAVRLDPKHIPAQVALAAAYERAGDLQSALRILQPLRELHRVAGGPLLLARVAMVLGQEKLAAESAHREPDREGGLIEPVSSILLVGEARLLEGNLRLKLGQTDQAVSAYYEAQLWGSAEAGKRLDSPSPVLERAMEARLREPRLSEDLRGRLLDALGSHRLRSGDVKGGVRMLLKTMSLSGYSCFCQGLRGNDPLVRQELERVRRDPRLPANVRDHIDSILKGPSPRDWAEPPAPEP